MGNYIDFESDFVERTLLLIAQYENTVHKYEFEKQFNHTLLINCLLGLIIMPKEKALSYLPDEKITIQLKKDMGIVESEFNSEISNLRDLIVQLRHSAAHSDIHFLSKDKDFLIDEIQFKNKDKGEEYVIATFIPSELLSFIRYYGSWFISNYRKNNPGTASPRS